MPFRDPRMKQKTKIIKKDLSNKIEKTRQIDSKLINLYF